MDDDDPQMMNDTTTASTTTTEFWVVRRPRVTRVRDLSPETRERLTQEYYDAYDPWTGVRTAATLGILISLFTLFLLYKSRMHSRAQGRAALPSKKSLYLYDPPSGSSASSYDLWTDCEHLEQVVVQVLAKQDSSTGAKYGTLRISDDASISLPCSPLKIEPQEHPQEPPSSLVGSIASFQEPPPPKDDRRTCSKHPSKKKRLPTRPKAVMVTTKRPQDYRSRSTVVSIARRMRAFS